MGQFIVIKGADFSNNPNAVNVNDIPIVDDQLYGVYSGTGAVLDTDGTSLVSLPSVFGEGVSAFPIGAKPQYIADSHFKGKAIVFHNTSNTPGIRISGFEGSLVDGISITFLAHRPYASNGSTSRVAIAMQGINLQFLTSSNTSNKHLQIGASPDITQYDIGFGSRPIGETEVLTLVIKKTVVKLYRNGTLLGQADITAKTLPDTYFGSIIFGSTWASSLSAGLNVFRSIQIHKKELTTQEVTDIHASLIKITV